MKWWGWALIGLVVGVALTMLIRFGEPTKEVAALKQELAVAAERSRVTDSLLARSLRITDSVARETAAIRARMMEEAQRAALADSNLKAAKIVAQVAREKLAEAQTAADSIPALVSTYRAEANRADAAELTLAATTVRLMTAGQLLANDSVVIAERDRSVAELTGDRDRWKATALQSQGVIDQLERRKRALGSRLAGGAETAALGAATIQSCTDGLLTLGCVAGSAATVWRIARGV